MCGIVAAVGERSDVFKGTELLHHRGPDAFGVSRVGAVTLGHTRLAILDIDERSNQPMRRGRTTVSYNGELWNFRTLRSQLEALGRPFSTTGDTEVVATAIDEWGVDALSKFDGMFAVAWTEDDDVLRLARDRFGEVPLHYADRGGSSELKGLVGAGLGPSATLVPPGGLIYVRAEAPPVFLPWHANRQPDVSGHSLTEAAGNLRRLVETGVGDRTLSDVPVCTLLSGGLDSTVIAIAAKARMPDLVAYTAVMDETSSDVKASRQVAAAIGCELREVKIPVPTLEDLRRTVQAIEMPYKAQVEIGWPCLVLAERMRADGFKVTFSGEGSDELWGSYGFAYHGIKADGWHAFRRDLFLSQHRKNFARCNKAFLSRGVECRLPFLHPPLVDYAWSLPQDSVRWKNRPKAVLEEAFRDVLPKVVATRSKVAFQDGLGMKVAALTVVGPSVRQFYVEAYDEAYPAAEEAKEDAGSGDGPTQRSLFD